MGFAIIRDEKTGIVEYDSRLLELDSDQAAEIRFIEKNILDENNWMRKDGHEPDKAKNPKLAAPNRLKGAIDKDVEWLS